MPTPQTVVTSSVNDSDDGIQNRYMHQFERMQMRGIEAGTIRTGEKQFGEFFSPELAFLEE